MIEPRKWRKDWNSGARSYEALRQLESAGVCETVNLQGGVAALKKAGLLDLTEEK
jgi:rhodanese-related sulfurtransferase